MNEKRKETPLFAFLGHPRNYKEIGEKYPILKFFPKFLVNIITRYAKPVIASKITGIKSQNGKNICGFFIAIPYTAEQILKNRNIAQKKILQAIKLAEKLKVKIIGLGGFTSSITNGGLDLIKENINIGITTGNSLTAGVTILCFKKIVKLKNIDLKKDKIAIVGATGSIGSAVSKYLIKINIGEIVLIGKTKKHLNDLKIELDNVYKKYKSKTLYNISDNINDIKKAKIVIVATNSAGAVIKKDNLMKNAIIYDITQPKNVDKLILKQRPDIRVIDGGLVKIENLNINLNVNLPPETSFACLAETILLSLENKFDNFSLGKVDIEKIEKMLFYFHKYNFKLSDFTSFGKKIDL